MFYVILVGSVASHRVAPRYAHKTDILLACSIYNLFDGSVMSRKLNSKALKRNLLFSKTPES